MSHWTSIAGNLLAREGRLEVHDGFPGALVDAAASLGVEPVLALVGARPGHRERIAHDFEHQDTWNRSKLIISIKPT